MDSTESLRDKLNKIKNEKSVKARILKKNIPMSLRVCLEISSAIIAGLIVGGILDYVFDTKVIFKIISLILGCIASFRVLYNLMVKK